MANGRDARGRFIKGHKGHENAGRPPRPIEERCFEDFQRVVTSERWCKAVDALLKKAERGDIQAFKVLAGYALGNPIQRIETTMDTTSEIDARYQQALERNQELGD